MTAPAPQPAPARGPVDIHVHLAGNGSGGSGCWMRLKSWRRVMAAFMVRQAGLPLSALRGDLDTLFADRLAEMVRASSLSAVVVLAHDEVYTEQGRKIQDTGTFHVPNRHVLSVASRHPRLLPGLSIHPARADALDELEQGLEAGGVLMKLLPACQNIDCNDRRYQRFWERMAEAGLPLLLHTGGEHTVEVVSPKLTDPRMMRLPLECGVNVISAHCATKSGPFDPDFFPQFVSMLDAYPNLYGDASAFTAPIRGRRIRECLRSPVAERLVHGSDFPVPASGWYPWWRGFVTWDALNQSRAERNPLERDYQIKRAMGFPAEHFTRAWQLLRLVPG